MATVMRAPPGRVRDAVLHALQRADAPLTVQEIVSRVHETVGHVASSSVRSYLRLNTPGTFERAGLGIYRLASRDEDATSTAGAWSSLSIDAALLVNADCFDWLADRAPNSVHAVVTDPPYGLVEYSEVEKQKLRAGKGGVWRIPPSFDGHARSPVPRFTTLSEREIDSIGLFFVRLGKALRRVLVPGGNIAIASNPLLAHVVASALAESGLEARGSIIRLVMTMRGGDRPKNAHHEFDGVSVLPRSMWEPWVLFRKEPEGRIQDNLRKWRTGGFRRPDKARPFGDVIKSAPTRAAERQIAPHPSLKPQAFMRTVVRGILPLGSGVILDPFCGSGSTLAAANAVGYDSIGIEADETYFKLACEAVPRLRKLTVKV